MKTARSLVLLTLLAAPAFAVDGVVLINQSIALAGGVTPGDSPGFPVTISVSGSYRLSGNLVVPDGNTTAIMVAADNVTIDLNGFSIIGPNTCSGFPVNSCSLAGEGFGIFGAGMLNTTVMNGCITGMTNTGIFLDSGKVDHVSVLNNALRGIVIGTGLISNSIALSNGRDGFDLSGTVINSISQFNGDSGILGSGLFTGNYSWQNGGSGVAASCPSTIIGNYAQQNTTNIATVGPGCVEVNNVGQ